jgi:hypothetical protein
MKSIEELLMKVNPAQRAWIGTIGPRDHNWTVADIILELQAKTGEQVDPASVEAYLSQNQLPIRQATASPPTTGQFSSAMERDIEIALVSQLDTLGLTLFVDQDGRSGKQYPAGEHGQIDVLALDSNENFVVIELKREAPRATIGQLAGYIAFVRNNLAKPRGRSAVGWIIARRSSPVDDRLLEEAAEAVGMHVRWYRVRLEFTETSASEPNPSATA